MEQDGRKEVPLSVRIVYPGGKFKDEMFGFRLTERQQKLLANQGLSEAEREERDSLLVPLKLRIAVAMGEPIAPNQIIVHAPLKVRHIDEPLPEAALPRKLALVGSEHFVG